MSAVLFESYKDSNKVLELTRICTEELININWDELKDLLLLQPKDEVCNSPSWMIHWYSNELGPCAVEDNETPRELCVEKTPLDASEWLFLNFIDLDQGPHTNHPTVVSAFKNTLDHINKLSGIRHAGIHRIGSKFSIQEHTDSSDIYSMIITFSVSKNNADKVVLRLSNGEEFNFKDNKFFTFVPSIPHSVSNKSDDVWMSLVLRINKTEFTQ